MNETVSAVTPDTKANQEGAPVLRTNRGIINIRSANSNTISNAWRDKLAISYSFIGDVIPDMTFRLGDRTFRTPIMSGAIAGAAQRAEGMPGYAKAVADAGSVYWTGFHHKDKWEEILAAGIPAVRVIKPLADNDQLLDEIRYDTEHGAVAYSMDICHAMNAYGEYDAQEEDFAPKTPQELRMLNEASPLPFILKDVMSVRDALIAADIGLYGIILSGHNNHLPCAVPPLRLLPDVRRAVGDRIKVFVDGGLDTGYEAFKALALGADGVLSARALMASFIKEGPAGLTEKLNQMTMELRGALANTASTDIHHIPSGCIYEL